ncbi:MAG: 5-oxoprolinase subunit PxpB [Burkholderiales bacterium]|nr:5-oxoprolinase subunit PxpB [Burkholderiales bacterium]
MPAGDLAVLVEIDEEIGPALSQRLRALEALASREIAGITETVPSFRALLVYYDPRLVSYPQLCAAIAERLPRASAAVLPATRLIELPCCYRDPELGFDLDQVAARLGLSVHELIRLQTSVDYLVYFIGFAPGQPYLTGMPERLAIARLETPRTKTPQGSVGIGGTQCCVYSVESPGGFWVLGRTPVKLYDPQASEPVLLRPGDCLRFVEIERREYDRIAAAVAARAYRVRIA